MGDSVPPGGAGAPPGPNNMPWRRAGDGGWEYQGPDGTWHRYQQAPPPPPLPGGQSVPPTSPVLPGVAPPNARDAQPGRGTPLRKRRRRWPAGVAALILLLIIVIAAVASGGKKPTATTSPSNSTASGTTTGSAPTSKGSASTTAPPTTAAPTTPKVGQVAKDGDFAFTVKSVQCGVTHLGTGTGFGETAPAGSQWCLVSMNVANDKTSSQSFFATNQYAIDAQGKRLSATTGGLIYLPTGSKAALSTVNPGVSITVEVPYQLAASDSISKFILHDSAFSGGVTVLNQS